MPTSRADIDVRMPFGANLVAGGALFRVWAPAAQQVFVLTGASLQAADHPGFHPSRDEAMFPLGDGSWGALVSGIADGAPYRFWVVGTGSTGLKRDPRARELSLVPAYPDCDCFVRAPDGYPWHDDGFRPPRFNEQIQYQLHVGVYYAIDENGNDKRRRIAKFLDLLYRVEYLHDLGVNAVLLLPIQEFASTTSRGYNGVDLFSPEMDYQVQGADLPRYLAKANALLAARGQSALTIERLRSGPDQLKCVIDIFHLHGLAVMFDLVFNHAGPGFNQQSLWFFDRQPEGDDNRSLYFTDRDWAGGRVFAFWKAEVRQFLIDNAKLCLEEYHIDGIRYDEVTVIDNNGGGRFCQDLSSTVRFLRPQAIQIAEYWRSDRDVAVRPAPAGLGFDAAWSDKLRDAIRGAIAQASAGRDAFVDIDAVARGFGNPEGFGAAWRAVNFIEDHDTVFNGRGRRVASLADPSNARSWHARSRARVAAGLLLAACGIPMLFMGQEILEDKQWDDDVGGHGDLLIRWDGLTADSAMADSLQFYRDLLWLRRREPAFSSDRLNVSTRNSLDRVIAIHRWIDGVGRDVFIVVNLQETNRFGYRVGFPGTGSWREIFNSDFYDRTPNLATIGNGGSIVAEAREWDGMPASSAITLPANGFIVFARR
jgi:1,4-alpha-glucan branching enzyme